MERSKGITLRKKVDNMNNRDLLVELRTDVKYIKEAVKENKEHLLEINGTCYKRGTTITILEETLKNHLQMHKKDLLKYTAIIGAIATILASIISFFASVFF